MYNVVFHTLRGKQRVNCFQEQDEEEDTRVGTLIVATIYLQLIQNRYMFQKFYCPSL